MMSKHDRVANGVPSTCGDWYFSKQYLPLRHSAANKGFFVTWDKVKTPPQIAREAESIRAAREAAAVAAAKAGAAFAAAAADSELMGAAAEAAVKATEASDKVRIAEKVEARRGQKAFGMYESAEELYSKSIMLLEPDQRCGYEIIREACAVYIDAEWFCDPKDADNSTHSRIRKCIAALRKYCSRDGREADVYVSCGSRLDSDALKGYKNSYHIVVSNYVFGCNERDTDGRLYAFVVNGLQSTSKWWTAPIFPPPPLVFFLMRAKRGSNPSSTTKCTTKTEICVCR